MKILITGSSGQLGQALVRSKPDFAEVIALQRSDLDLTDIKKCKEVILAQGSVSAESLK